MLTVTKVLKTSIRIFQERFGGPAGQGTSLEESLFLFLMLINQLKDECDLESILIQIFISTVPKKITSSENLSSILKRSSFV